MKKIAIISLFLAFFSTVSHAAMTSKGYVDAGLNTRQEKIVNSDTIVVDENDKTKLKAVAATRDTAGVVKFGEIPVGQTGDTVATIWVE